MANHSRRRALDVSPWFRLPGARAQCRAVLRRALRLVGLRRASRLVGLRITWSSLARSLQQRLEARVAEARGLG